MLHNECDGYTADGTVPLYCVELTPAKAKAAPPAADPAAVAAWLRGLPVTELRVVPSVSLEELRLHLVARQWRRAEADAPGPQATDEECRAHLPEAAGGEVHFFALPAASATTSQTQLLPLPADPTTVGKLWQGEGTAALQRVPREGDDAALLLLYTKERAYGMDGGDIATIAICGTLAACAVGACVACCVKQQQEKKAQKKEAQRVEDQQHELAQMQAQHDQNVYYAGNSGQGGPQATPGYYNYAANTNGAPADGQPTYYNNPNPYGAPTAQPTGYGVPPQQAGYGVPPPQHQQPVYGTPAPGGAAYGLPPPNYNYEANPSCGNNGNYTYAQNNSNNAGYGYPTNNAPYSPSGQTAPPQDLPPQPLGMRGKGGKGAETKKTMARADSEPYGQKHTNR